ncbi:hypothetical protein GGR58DRAFT_293495 [Xylaria digitata]|nr:hypothetical protein GGR58DRAFT_293495 [Xylaria digitata]
MCTWLVSTTKYTGCPPSCNTTSTRLAECEAARQSGNKCANPGKSMLASTTSRIKCPNHRDEGYSQRQAERYNKGFYVKGLEWGSNYNNSSRVQNFL